MMKKNPLSVENITELFTLNKEKNKLIKRESVSLEYKESFNFGSMAMYFRTIASFANRNGGYIIFGIMYIHELKNKPAICKKNYDSKEEKYSLKDGDIYYRYSGRSQKIRYPELIEIIDKKRKNEERMWLDYLIKSSRIGIENIGLLDLNSGNIQGNNIKSIYIDEGLLKQIKFIQEGNFSETKGSPALKLMGEIENINGEKIIIKEEKEKIKIRGISETDIIETFLLDKDVSEESEEYIKEITNCKSAFVPVYYYLTLNNFSLNEGIDIIENVNVRTNAKTKVLERLKEHRREKENIPLNSREVIEHILNSVVTESFELKEDNKDLFLKAIISADDQIINEHTKFIKRILLDIFNKDYSSENRSLVGKIRKAICRVDETLYDSVEKAEK